MSRLLSIQSSIFGDQGQSSLLAARYIDAWRAANPAGEVVTRDLSAAPIPHLDAQRFTALGTPVAQRTAAQQQVVDLSDALIEELRAADTVLLSVPMYNFTAPSVLHAYFDHVARAGVTFRYTENGPEGLLQGKRAIVLVTRGGQYGTDHAQAHYLRQFLGFIGIVDIEFVYAEGLAMGEEGKSQALQRAGAQLAALV